MQKKEQLRNQVPPLSRRSLLLRAPSIALLGLFPSRLFSPLARGEKSAPAPQPPPSPANLSPVDDQFLDDLEKLNFKYFWEQASPQTGLIKDRCTVLANDTSAVASIAATGFGLTALCIGENRGFIPLADARGRVLATLRFLWKKMPTHRGFFYHFADLNTGERVWDSEVSSVDTTILLCGILCCRQHFDNSP